jgi:hypothetical protein
MEALFDSLLTDSPAPQGKVVIQPLYGGSDKAVRDMSLNELQTISDVLIANVREAAFSRGLPLVYEVAGRVVREYANGRIESVD